jgi:hypothetical protein
MVVRSFCASGNNEGLKGAVHASAAAIVALCAAYNVTAWYFRRDRHLQVNAIVYTLAVAWELKQTMHHLAKVEPCLARKGKHPVAA